MGALAAYFAGTLLLPAALAWAVGLAVLRGGVRRNAAAVDAAVAAAVAAAFTVAFVRELEPAALLRQVGAAPAGDDGAIERWHRLGLSSLAMVAAAPVLALVAARAPWSRGRSAAAMAVVAGIVLAVGVPLPGPDPAPRAFLGCACAMIALELSACGLTTALGATALTLVILAAMSLAGGFISLAVIAGATALGTGAMALTAWRGSRAGSPALPSAAGATSTVLGAILGLVGTCGAAYSDAVPPTWSWAAATVLAAFVAAAMGLRRHSGLPRSGIEPPGGD